MKAPKPLRQVARNTKSVEPAKVASAAINRKKEEIRIKKENERIGINISNIAGPPRERRVVRQKPKTSTKTIIKKAHRVEDLLGEIGSLRLQISETQKTITQLNTAIRRGEVQLRSLKQSKPKQVRLPTLFSGLSHRTASQVASDVEGAAAAAARVRQRKKEVAQGVTPGWMSDVGKFMVESGIGRGPDLGPGLSLVSPRQEKPSSAGGGLLNPDSQQRELAQWRRKVWAARV